MVYFLSESIVNVLYGSQYLEAAPVLGLYFCSAIFVFIGVASSKWFVTENLQIFSFYRTLAGVITNIALNLWLIPIYGIWGAALATLISQAIASYLFNCINPRVRIVFVQQTKALIAPIRYFRMKRA